MHQGCGNRCPGRGAGGQTSLPKSPAAFNIPVDSEGGPYEVDPRIRVMNPHNGGSPRKSSKSCCSKRSERMESDAYSQRLNQTSPAAQRSMYSNEDDYIDHVVRGTPSPTGNRSMDQSGARAYPSPPPLLTPPPLGSYPRRGTPSPLPFDFSFGFSTDPSSPEFSTDLSLLESSVEEELRNRSLRSPGSPVEASGSKATTVSPMYVMTPQGPVKASHQVSMERTVRRLPDMELISRKITGSKLEETTAASQVEINYQQLEPGGLNAMGREGVSQEVISVTDTVTVAPGVTTKTNTCVYEYTVPTQQTELDPAQVLEMIEEESKEVEKMKNLQPPELKGVEDYGLKKKLQKMKLNRESVRRLESSVINPPPTADEAQEELQPELMAAIMHTEEQGLTMDSAPANVYNYLFPEVKDDTMVIKISSVAPSPLQNVVVPVEVPSTLHTAGVTREMQFAAATSRCGLGALPVDNIYEKTVKRTGAAPKVNNTAVQGKKIMRLKDYPLLSSEEPPWGAEDLQPIMTLVGASPSHTMPSLDASNLESPSVYHNEMENSLEYQLIPEAPRHVSRVQLRGSQKPSWFPGYIIALPDSIKLARSPSEVLPAAWQAVQPDIFAEDSFVVV